MVKRLGIGSSLKKKTSANIPKGVATSTYSTNSSTYDLSAADSMVIVTSAGKTGYMIAGRKGTGKTRVGLSFQEIYEGDMLCFSYDGQTAPIWAKDFGKSDKFVIYDIEEQFEDDPALKRESGNRCVDIVMSILMRYKAEGKQVDWVFHDMIDLLSTITEMKARRYLDTSATKPCGKFDPIWKIRKAYLKDIYNTSLKVSRYGVICTGKVFTDDILNEGVVIKTGERKPAWTGTIEDKTQIVIMLDVEETVLTEGVEHHRYAYIDSSKREYPKNHVYYHLDGKEDLTDFIMGNGREANRAPPKKKKLNPVASDSNPDTPTGKVKKSDVSLSVPHKPPKSLSKKRT